MKYKVEIKEKAKKTLSKLDKFQSLQIYNWIVKNLDECSDPYKTGKALTGNMSGYWRYRVGAYRIIADIDEKKIKIIIVDVGHRREVYSRINKIDFSKR